MTTPDAVTSPPPGLSDRLERAGIWPRLAIAIITGALMTLGHAPTHLPWTFFIAVPAAIWLVTASATPRQAAVVGWGVGFGYFVTGLHWIGHAFLVDPERHAWMMPFAITLLPGFLALFWAAAFWLARQLWPEGPARRAILLAACWTLVELARGYVLTGFPWALPGYVWVETPVLQAASFAGPFGLTLIILVLTGLPLSALIERKWITGLTTVTVFAGFWVWGAARVPETILYAEDAPLIRVVQPNAPQHQKWESGYADLFYQRLLKLTALPTEDGGRPDVVIWPETSVTFLPAREPDRRAEIAAAARGAPVIMGTLHAEQLEVGYALTNSMLTILPDGTMGPRYDKHHLVPFGEYLPLAWVLQPLGLSDIAFGGGFTEGPGPRTMTLDGLPAFAAAICYEMIFPNQIIGPGPRPDWIVTVTNDAWFGGFAGPQQHRDQARFRAVEQGLPVARSANTGISTIIDTYGRPIEQVKLHQNGAVDTQLPISLAPTIYAQTGDFIALLACLLGIAPFWRKINVQRKLTKT